MSTVDLFYLLYLIRSMDSHGDDFDEWMMDWRYFDMKFGEEIVTRIDMICSGAIEGQEID